MGILRKVYVHLVLLPLGRSRAKKGFCPACNSSPPTAECVICSLPDVYGLYGQTNARLPDYRYHFKAPREKRERWYNDYKARLLHGERFRIVAL